MIWLALFIVLGIIGLVGLIGAFVAETNSGKSIGIVKKTFAPEISTSILFSHLLCMK